MSKVARGQTDPQPAPAQVWRSRKYPSMVNVVAKVDGHAVVWTHGGWDDLAALRGFYECIGIETPAGRVMVGERRRYVGASDVEILAVVGADSIRWRCVDGHVEHVSYARDAATWPLLPPEAPAPLAAAAPQAYREPAQWGRASIGGVSSPPAPIGRAVGQYAADGDIAVTVADLHKALAATGMTMDVERLGDRLGLRWDTSSPAPPAVPRFPTAFPAPPDPRAEREQRRRAISAALAEDARRWPAFATARRAAVMAWYEGRDDTPMGNTEVVLALCVAYERERGGATRPSADADKRAKRSTGCFGFTKADVVLGHYERARALP